MIKAIMLSILISISLFARLNPFEVDPTIYKVDKQEKPIPVKNISSVDDNKKTIKIKPQTINNKKIIVSKRKEKKRKEKKKYNTNNITKIPKPIIKSFVPANYKVLPFLSVDVDYKDIKLKSRTKYHIINYYNLENIHKVAFDFYGKVSFNTKYKKLTSPSFKSFKIGNHPNIKMFRVAIKLKHPAKDYSISIKQHTAHIKYNK
jgi:hypothetical protein